MISFPVLSVRAFPVLGSKILSVPGFFIKVFFFVAISGFPISATSLFIVVVLVPTLVEISLVLTVLLVGISLTVFLDSVLTFQAHTV